MQEARKESGDPKNEPENEKNLPLPGSMLQTWTVWAGASVDGSADGSADDLIDRSVYDPVPGTLVREHNLHEYNRYEHDPYGQDEITVDDVAEAVERTDDAIADVIDDRIDDHIDEVLIGRLGTRLIQVEPGDAASFSISLLNNGTIPARFLLQVEGWVDEAWFPDLPQELELEPGVWTTISLAVTPPRVARSWAGKHPFALTIHSPDYPTRSTRLGLTLVIAPFDEFQVSALHPDFIETDRRTRSGTTRLRVMNRGNRRARYRLWGAEAGAHKNKHSTWEFVFRAAGDGEIAHDFLEFDVEPGAARTIGCRIAAGGMPPLVPLARITAFRIGVEPVDLSAVTFAAPSSTAIAPVAFTPVGPDMEAAPLVQPRRVVAGRLAERPLIGIWGLTAVISVLLGAIVFAGVVGIMALAALQNRAAQSPRQTAEQPSVTLMLQMQEHVPVGTGSEIQGLMPGADDGQAPMQNVPVQSSNAPGPGMAISGPASSLPLPVVGAADVTAPNAAAPDASMAYVTMSAEPGAATIDRGEPAANDSTANDSTMQSVPSSGDVSLGIVQADQVSAPGESVAPPIGRGETDAETSETADLAAGNSTGSTAFAATAAPSADEAPRLTYAQMFQDVGMRYDLDWRMLAAQAYIESGFDALALGNHGSMGLMQIQPQTWREWAPVIAAADPFDSYSNAMVAGLYLDYLRSLLASQGYPQVEWMLVAYNWGPDRLLGFLERGGDWASLPAEVRNYAEDVLRIARTIPPAHSSTNR